MIAQQPANDVTPHTPSFPAEPLMTETVCASVSSNIWLSFSTVTFVSHLDGLETKQRRSKTCFFSCQKNTNSRMKTKNTWIKSERQRGWKILTTSKDSIKSIKTCLILQNNNIIYKIRDLNNALNLMMTSQKISLLMCDVTGCYADISMMTSWDLCLALLACLAVKNNEKQQKNSL